MSEQSALENFESAMTELEETVAQLEAGQLSLQETLALFERGQELAARCGTALDEAELRLTQLQSSGGGYDITGMDN